MHIDAGGIHIRKATRAQILKPFAHIARAFALTAEIIAHQADESGVVDSTGRNEIPIHLVQLWWNESFLGRNPAITRSGPDTLSHGS